MVGDGSNFCRRRLVVAGMGMLARGLGHCARPRCGCSERVGGSGLGWLGRLAAGLWGELVGADLRGAGRHNGLTEPVSAGPRGAAWRRERNCERGIAGRRRRRRRRQGVGWPIGLCHERPEL